MNRAMLLAMPLLLTSGPSFAVQSHGNAALALAALIGENSPTLSHADKAVLAHFLGSSAAFALPPHSRQITVKADKIRCRMGDVDLTLHDCTLTFGATTLTETGRSGQTLLATMQENGVAADGAAGTIYYSVAPMTCIIDPAEVKSHDGGGAMCTFTNGP